MKNWHIPTNETRNIWLFFWHNFLLGIGTILVYVSANVILLENQPETSLPIAYILSAFALFGVGKVYEYFEHHLKLKTLARAVLMTILALVFLSFVILFVGHSVAIAVGIMVGYRVIYLLGNLEFWGISALAFDVRQSKRLFGVIGSGDMPAKALGAILAALIHSSSAMLILLGLSFFAFLGAFFIQKLTFKNIDLPDPHHAAIRKNRPHSAKIIQRLFEGNGLVFQLCLCVMAIAAAATWIEYHFFVNVKYKFHSQHDVLTFIGILLMVTYLLATGIKFLFSGPIIEKYGVKYAIYLLPATTLLISLGLVVSSYLFKDEASLLVDYCVAYIGFEVVRRTIFDPVFLVLFQPLSVKTRLKGHTLAKGVYEPLGMGLAGVLLWVMLQYGHLAVWATFVFTMLCALAAMIFATHAYLYYVNELKAAIAKRFVRQEDVAPQADVQKMMIEKLESADLNEQIYAFQWLVVHRPDKLRNHVPALLESSSADMRRQVLAYILEQRSHHFNDILEKNIAQESDLENQLLMAEAIASQNHSLIQHHNLTIVLGAMKAVLKTNKNHTMVLQKLTKLSKSEDIESKLAALNILSEFPQNEFDDFIRTSLEQPNERLNKAAIAAAKPCVDGFLPQISTFIDHKNLKNESLEALISAGEKGIDLIKNAENGITINTLQKAILLLGQYPSEAGQQWLMRLAESPFYLYRKLALRALQQQTFAETAFFDELVKDEIAHLCQLLSGLQSQLISLQSFDYEQKESLKRLFYLCVILYDKSSIRDARNGLESQLKEKRANALETLEHVLPHWLYNCLNALVGTKTIEKRIETLSQYITERPAALPFAHYALEYGDERLGLWTVVETMQNWQVNQIDSRLLLPYLSHSHHIFREVAWQKLEKLPYKVELLAHIDENTVDMKKKHNDHLQVSEIERVITLKNTPIFAQISENVLTAVAPIMQEVRVNAGQMIFEKGDLGDSMYVIEAGEVAITDQETELARFGRYDFFGELALLDAETRSAGAMAVSEALLFKINQDDFYELLEERPELMRNIVKTLSQRIRALNQKMANL